MNVYSVAGWDGFFVAKVGAAAALAGLLFVAVSINYWLAPGIILSFAAAPVDAWVLLVEILR